MAKTTLRFLVTVTDQSAVPATYVSLRTPRHLCLMVGNSGDGINNPAARLLGSV